MYAQEKGRLSQTESEEEEVEEEEKKGKKKNIKDSKKKKVEVYGFFWRNDLWNNNKNEIHNYIRKWNPTFKNLNFSSYRTICNSGLFLL